MLGLKLFKRRINLSEAQRQRLDKVLESLLSAPERAYEQSVAPALENYRKILDHLERRGYDVSDYRERLVKKK